MLSILYRALHGCFPAGEQAGTISCSTPHAFNECERVDGLGVGLDTLDMGPRTIRSVSNCISAVPGEGGKGAAAERHGAR